MYRSIVVVVTISVSCLLNISGCDGSADSSQLQFILPNHFRGVFVISEDPNAPPATVGGDGVYRLRVPKSARIKVQDTSFLNLIGSMKAKYVNGGRLPAMTLNSQPPYSDEVSLNIVRGDSDGSFYFFVGTDRDKAALYKSGDLELGGVKD